MRCSQWPEITNDMFIVAAELLSRMTSDEEASRGHLFLFLFADILDISAKIMGQLISQLGDRVMTVADATEFAAKSMWQP